MVRCLLAAWKKGELRVESPSNSGRQKKGRWALSDQEAKNTKATTRDRQDADSLST